MTETIISAETCGGNTDDAYASCLGKLATPGATEVTFTQEETGAFYNHEGRRLSSSKLMRGIEAEMSGGHFNASARTILAIDGGTCVGGAEYLAVAGRLGLPLTIMVRGGVDMGAASGCLDNHTLRNSVPREQRYEIGSRVAAAQILQRYGTNSLHMPHTTVPPSVWWGALFGSGGDDLLRFARVVNAARAERRDFAINSFRAPLIAATALIMSEVKVRAPDTIDDAQSFLLRVIAGFCGADTPKDDPARVTHERLAGMTKELLGGRGNHLDARAFTAILVGWEHHANGRPMPRNDPRLGSDYVTNAKGNAVARIAVAIPQ